MFSRDGTEHRAVAQLVDTEAKKATDRARCEYRSAAVRDRRLNNGDVRLYWLLDDYADSRTGEAWPSQVTLANALGVCRQEINDRVSRLRAAGYLLTRPRGRGLLYVLSWAPAFMAAAGPVRKSRHEVSSNGDTEPHHQNLSKNDDERPRGQAPAPRKTASLEGARSRLTSEAQSAPAVWCTSEGKAKTENPKQNTHSSDVRPKQKNEDQAGDALRPAPRSPRPAFPHPEMELRARMDEHHPAIAPALVKLIMNELNGAPLVEFLELDAERTTNPAKLYNPHGYYRGLARQVRRDASAGVSLRSIDETLVQVSAGLAAGRAKDVEFTVAHKPRCCNEGKRPDGSFCSCKVGALRAQLSASQQNAKGAA